MTAIDRCLLSSRDGAVAEQEKGAGQNPANTHRSMSDLADIENCMILARTPEAAQLCAH